MNVSIAIYGVRLLSRFLPPGWLGYIVSRHPITRAPTISVHRPLSLCRSYVRKAKKSAPSVVELVEGEHDVINLGRVEGAMATSLQALKHEYTTSVTARITPASLDRISVDIDGQSYPLKQVAQLGMPNPQTILINMSAYPESVSAAVKAIHAADLNLNPLVERNTIKIPIPKMTGELRESLAKLAKSHAERAKVGVRKARQRGMADLKKNKSVSEDTVRRLEKYLQQLTDKHVLAVEDLLSAKTTELTKAR